MELTKLCPVCDKIIEKEIICKLCNLSFYCSERCRDNDNSHINKHKYINSNKLPENYATALNSYMEIFENIIGEHLYEKLYELCPLLLTKLLYLGFDQRNTTINVKLIPLTKAIPGTHNYKALPAPYICVFYNSDDNLETPDIIFTGHLYIQKEEDDIITAIDSINIDVEKVKELVTKVKNYPNLDIK